MRTLTLTALFAFSFVATACGGNAPESKTPPAAPEKTAPAEQHDANPSLTERVDTEHEKFKKSIEKPAREVDEATRAVIAKGKEVVGVEASEADASQPAKDECCPCDKESTGGQESGQAERPCTPPVDKNDAGQD